MSLHIRTVPSPHFGPRPPGVAPSLIVIHSISLPPGQYGGPEVEQLFTGTLLMFSLGIIGYYLAKIYDEVKRRPRYVIAETLDDAP